MTVNETVISVDAGDHCYVRGVNNSAWATQDSTNQNRIATSGGLAVEGNVMTLLDWENPPSACSGSY